MLIAKAGLGHHAFDRVAEDVGRLAGHEGVIGDLAEAADEAGILFINFAGSFHAGDFDFLGIDDHNAIATIDVGGEIGAMFAAENVRDH